MDVDDLIKKFKTRDPFEIANNLSITILYEELGTIKGYFCTVARMKFIHINSNLKESCQRFTAAHELGHAILHQKANTPFLRKSTLLSVNKLEIEANKFAVDLLISNEEINECETIAQLSAHTGLNEKLIELRLRR